jgi:hypothetical protein
LCAISTGKKIMGQSSIRLVSSPQQLAPIDTVWLSINRSSNLLSGINGKAVLLKP